MNRFITASLGMVHHFVRKSKILALSRGRPTVTGWSQPLVSGRRSTRAISNPPAHRMIRDAQAEEGTQPTPRGPRRNHLRIVFATNELAPGGMTSVVETLATSLRDQGAECRVLSGSPVANHDAGRRLQQHGIDVTYVQPSDRIEFLLDSARCVGSIHGAPQWLVDKLANAGLPSVETLHRSAFTQGEHETHARRGETVNSFVAVSDRVRTAFLAAMPSLPIRRIHVIPNGTRGDWASSGDRSCAREQLGLSDEFVFVSLARYCIQKNPYALVSAFQEFASEKSDVHLVLAGEAEHPVLAAKLSRLVKKNGRGRTHLRSRHPDVPQLLAAADAFVLDSYFEGWPLASMEALCAGIPIIISDVGGGAEQIAEDPRNGILIPAPLPEDQLTWSKMHAALYAPQENRTQLLKAFSEIYEKRGQFRVDRNRLGQESRDRFAFSRWVNAHFELLTAASRSAVPSMSQP